MLVLNDRITETGKTSYWAGIDASFRFNVLKRELFLAKTLISTQSVSVPSGCASSKKNEHNKSQSPSNDRRDPMMDFFARRCSESRRNHMDSSYKHRYEGCHMDVREDRHDRRFEDSCRSYNRFMMPRPR